MFDAITNDYLIADETLLLHRQSSEYIAVPGAISPGYRITRIGKSAFSGDKDMKVVEIPDGITYVGDNNFLVHDTLSAIYIPTSVTTWKDSKDYWTPGKLHVPNCYLTMTETEYNRLLSESVCVSVSEGNYLIQNPDVFPILGQLIPSLNYALPARLPKEIPVLFSDNNPPYVNALYITAFQQCLRFDGVDEKLSEDEAFRRMFFSGTLPPLNSDAEQFDDHCISCDKQISYEKVTLVLFSPEQVKINAAGRRIVPLIFRQDFFYWQSAVKVCCRGHQYLIYRRNYITPNPKIPYHRLDVAVYDEHGLVNDRALSEEVYAKYKLSFMF